MSDSENNEPVDPEDNEQPMSANDSSTETVKKAPDVTVIIDSERKKSDGAIDEDSDGPSDNTTKIILELIKLAIALVGLLGVGYICTLTFDPDFTWIHVLRGDTPATARPDNEIEIGATQTAIVMTQTALAFTDTPNPTLIEPTSTASYTPTATSTDLPTAPMPPTLTFTPLPPTALPSSTPTTVPTIDPIQSQLNSAFGEGNWFCIPTQTNSVGVRDLPRDYVVQSPVRQIDTDRGTVYSGQTPPCCLGATAWLARRIPQSECPQGQLAHLEKWQSDHDQYLLRTIPSAFVDQIFSSNWDCPDAFNHAAVGTLAQDTTIEYPIIGISADPSFYGVGEIIPAGTRVTVWFSRTMPIDTCN